MAETEIETLTKEEEEKKQKEEEIKKRVDEELKKGGYVKQVVFDATVAKKATNYFKKAMKEAGIDISDDFKMEDASKTITEILESAKAKETGKEKAEGDKDSIIAQMKSTHQKELDKERKKNQELQEKNYKLEILTRAEGHLTSEIVYSVSDATEHIKRIWIQEEDGFKPRYPEDAKDGTYKKGDLMVNADGEPYQMKDVVNWLKENKSYLFKDTTPDGSGTKPKIKEEKVVARKADNKFKRGVDELLEEAHIK